MRRHGTKLHGIVAEFDSPEAIIAAANAARAAGYKRMDSYTPFPVHGLSEAMGFRSFVVPFTFFFGAVLGGLAGLALEWYVSVADYPINVGGKPLFSLGSFVPPAYECVILFSALIGTIGMFAFNGLPKPYHPIFGAPGFERASQDRFFLCLEADDEMVEEDATSKFLQGLRPLSISV
ncbi:MAG: DUF3341 domain-containing protein, partial [Fimbriimonas ginsengisoli]|nr:DUF3341 domain-containing protein [Fimbriimonas ginsengisoli]